MCYCAVKIVCVLLFADEDVDRSYLLYICCPLVMAVIVEKLDCARVVFPCRSVSELQVVYANLHIQLVVE